MIIRNISFKLLLPVFILQSVLTSVATAQDFNPDPDWKTTINLWMTSLDGTLGISLIEADIDVSFSDLVSSLDFGGEVVARRDWGANMLVGDLTYLTLSPDDQPTPGGGSISPGLDLTLLSAFYGRKWGSDEKYGALTVGARYMEMDLTMKANPNLPSEPELKKNGSPSFTDFVIGGLVGSVLNAKWNVLVQADVGVGGSNNSWTAQLMFQRKLKSGNRLNLGARVLSVDFTDTVASGDDFTLDARMTGLMIGFTFD